MATAIPTSCFRTHSGQVAIWEMNGTNIIGGGIVSANPGPSWHAIGTGGGGADILFQSTSGQTAIWDMNGTSIIGGGVVSPNPGTSWRAVGTDLTVKPRIERHPPPQRPDGDDDESRAAEDGEDRGDPVHRHAGRGDRVERADAGRGLARRAIAAGDEHADRGDELPAAVKADQKPRRPRRRARARPSSSRPKVSSMPALDTLTAVMTA